MFDFIRMAPGVSATTPGSLLSNSVSVFGSGTNENALKEMEHDDQRQDGKPREPQQIFRAPRSSRGS